MSKYQWYFIKFVLPRKQAILYSSQFVAEMDLFFSLLSRNYILGQMKENIKIFLAWQKLLFWSFSSVWREFEKTFATNPKERDPVLEMDFSLLQ